MANVLDVLKERGFIEQVSDEGHLRKELESPITCYVGYDPSASSLHVGNLLTIMALAHMQRAGHRPIAIVGGGTGMIGDPSGKTEMRKMLTEERIALNIAAQKEQIGRFVDLNGSGLLINNAEWLRDLNYIDFLRDVGRHFSVNRMLASEAYRTRLQTGLSFLEFNYQLLQAYDYLHLYRNYGCILQMGGNDQWGNILAGVDLIRRIEGGSVYAVTFPLLTTASGAKMGKTAKGAIWLDAKRLRPYDFYQFWINTADADVERFLKIYTFLPLDEIRRLSALEGSAIREAKRVLAFEVTRNTHGEKEALAAQRASDELFGDQVKLDEVPTAMIPAADLAEGIGIAELLYRVGLSESKSAARRLVQQGGAYLNGEQVESIERVVATDDVVDGAILLRAGKKRYRRVKSE